MDCEKDLLLKNAKSGDKAALVKLALTHSPDVYRIAFYLLRSEEEAQDAAADIFSKLYVVPNQIPWEYFRSWLLRVTHNHCMDILRQRKVLNRLLPRLYAKIAYSQSPNPEHTAIEADEQAEVRRILANLPEQDREILVLRYYQQLNYDEISKILGIPKNTAGSRLHRAREKLREMLRHNEGVTENETMS